MCARVTLSFVIDNELITIDAPTPIDLLELGLELIDIEEEFVYDCWCNSDPLPTLAAAGFNVEYDEMFNEYFAESDLPEGFLTHNKPKAPVAKTEDCSL